MQENQNSQKPIQIIPILKESFFLYKANFKLLFLISLLGSSITLIEQLLPLLNVSSGWFGSITMIVGVVVSLWAHIALIFAVFNRFNGQSVDVKEAFASTKNKIWRFAGVSIICFLLFIFGSLLFIVPGLYWGTIFALAGLVVILEDTAFYDSFKRSKALIQGNFWPIFLLNVVIFLIFASPYLFYTIDATSITESFIIVFISILYLPWIVAIDINIYNRLKKFKGDTEQLESEDVKKGVGCLGCLGMIALAIAIIASSSIWYKKLGGFIETEKGRQVYEWVSQKVSPKITFEDGVFLERPDGYLVTEDHQQFTKYTFYGFLNNKLFKVYVFSHSYEDLGINASSVQFGDGAIWDKYHAYYMSRFPYADVLFKDMEKDSVKVFDVAGRSWAEYVLKEKERENAKSRKVWAYDYALSDSVVIFISYGYMIYEDEEESDVYADEIKKILGQFRF